MPSIARSLATIVVFAILRAAPARAQEVKAGDVVITQHWTRATPNGA